MPAIPSVLFVCVKNGGKSQMAAGLMKKAAGDAVYVHSAGTRPGDAVNGLSAQALQEVGINITGQTPKAITAEMVRGVDLVVTLGRDAKVAQIPGTRFEVWDTDEPSDRGINGIERMRHGSAETSRRTTSAASSVGESIDDARTHLDAP